MINPSTVTGASAITEKRTAPLQESKIVNTSNSGGNSFQLPPRKKQRVEVHEVDTEGAEYICKANDVMRIKFLMNLDDLDSDDDSDDEENENNSETGWTRKMESCSIFRVRKRPVTSARQSHRLLPVSSWPLRPLPC